MQSNTNYPEGNERNWDGSTVASNSTIESEGFTETESEGRLSPAPSIYSLTPSLRDQSYIHAHGRGLNAHSDIYSLPVDDEEAQRLSKHHTLFYLLSLNDNYYGFSSSVWDVLAPTHERQRKALDLGCGPGSWAIQCAIDFPHVEVLGVDLAPMNTTIPPPNCRFEIDDVNLGLDHFFGPTFDIVHARLLSSGVKDYAGLVDQLSRCLRPGGIVTFAEVDFRIWSEDKRLLIPPNFYTPLPSKDRPSLASGLSSNSNGGSNSGTGPRAQHATKLTQWAIPTWMAMLSKCIRAKGGNIDSAVLMKTWLREHPNYEDVQTRDLWAPLGPWKPTVHDEWTTHPNFNRCGEMSRDNLIALMKGGRPLLYGWLSEQEVAELEGNALREVEAATRPMYIRTHVTFARRKGTSAQ